MKKNKKYWNKIAGYLSGEMNKMEMETFIQKVKTNKELKNDYTLMKKTWTDFNSNPDEKYKDTNRAWDALNKKIEKIDIVESAPVHMTAIQYTLRIAAVIVLILADGIPAINFSADEFSFNKSIIEH
nr:hypothetical protein [Bacteroidales bacterium]